MKEIPMAFVKANQTGIVLLIILAAVFNQPWIVAALWVIQVVGLMYRRNLFVMLVKPFLTVRGKPTQAAELQRFNNVLAVGFLTLALLSFLFHLDTLGFIFLYMLALAAFAALCGYCFGCTVYYQYKRMKAMRKS